MDGSDNAREQITADRYFCGLEGDGASVAGNPRTPLKKMGELPSLLGLDTLGLTLWGFFDITEDCPRNNSRQ